MCAVSWGWGGRHGLRRTRGSRWAVIGRRVISRVEIVLRKIPEIPSSVSGARLASPEGKIVPEEMPKQQSSSRNDDHNHDTQTVAATHGGEHWRDEKRVHPETTALS